MIDPVVKLFTVVMVGQILFSIPMLLKKAQKYSVSMLLIVFLFSIGSLALVPVVEVHFPHCYQLYSALVFPTLFLLCPSLWLYVEGITSEKHWQLNKKHTRYFVFLLPAFFVSTMMLLIPNDMHTALFVEDADVADPLAKILLIGLLVNIVLWLGQCGLTFFRIVTRLISYRKQLKNTFSNDEGKQLLWFNWFLFVAVCTWFVSLVTLFSLSVLDSTILSARVESFLLLLLIWLMSYFGLKQKPVFTEFYHSQDTYLTPETKGEENTLRKSLSASHTYEKGGSSEKPNSLDKYQRSALGQAQASRIADKINKAMQVDKLYLDANLSLHKLSRHVSISPNYVSQTLNETLSTNFFDFVNSWRVEAAKPKIIDNQKTVLDIAFEVGFNARSSFYKAFKRETGKTPSEFRRQAG